MFGGFGDSGLSALGSGTSVSSAASSSDVGRQWKGASHALSVMAGNLPEIDEKNARPGDIFFHIANGHFIGHTNMIAPDTKLKIDSVDPDGVRKAMLCFDRHPAIVFRFADWHVAQCAAQLALGWAPERPWHPRLPNEEPLVHYSGGAIGLGLTGRVVQSLMGTTHFGKGANGRLHKYLQRDGMRPKNVICSEMCLLAYQLCLRENDPSFPRLDAKHTTPSVLYKYMTGPGAKWWTVVGKRSGRR